MTPTGSCCAPWTLRLSVAAQGQGIDLLGKLGKLSVRCLLLTVGLLEQQGSFALAYQVCEVAYRPVSGNFVFAVGLRGGAVCVTASVNYPSK